MSHSHVQEALANYHKGQYKALKAEGSLGLVRELVSKVVFSNMCKGRKTWQLAIPADTDILKLPYLTIEEKVKLYHIIGQQSFYPKKHLGKIFAYRGKVYVKDYYHFKSRTTKGVMKVDNLCRVVAPVSAFHDLEVFTHFGIYSSAFQTFANKVRLLILLYQDPNNYTVDELALLKDTELRPRTGKVNVSSITKVPILYF